MTRGGRPRGVETLGAEYANSVAGGRASSFSEFAQSDDVKEAIVHFRAALKVSGKDEPGVVRYFLAQALLRSSRAEDRIEGKTIFDALANEPPLPEGHPLQPLREEIRVQTAARTAVRELDDVSQEGTSSLANVLAHGEKALPWLFHQFSDFARGGSRAGACGQREQQRIDRRRDGLAVVPGARRIRAEEMVPKH